MRIKNKKHMSKNGKSLERLIASLEKALGQNHNVTVAASKRLPDRTTGKLREHDVLLTVTQAHHSVKIAIECRDRSRPITVNQVEGFWAKCQDTGIDQGIIVSSAGFCNTAKKKAEHHGIRCLCIEEVESFNWLLAPGIHSFTKKIIQSNWIFYPERDGVIDKTKIELLDANNNVVSQSVLTANAQQQLNKLLPHPPAPIADGELKVKFEGGGLMLRDLNSGAKVKVSFILATIRYSVTEELIPFRMMQYVDKNREENITDAAVAELSLGEYSGKLMIVYKEDKGGHVVFVPEKKG